MWKGIVYATNDKLEHRAIFRWDVSIADDTADNGIAVTKTQVQKVGRRSILWKSKTDKYRGSNKNTWQVDI